MIPTGGQIPAERTLAVQQPSRTWRLDFERGRVAGMIDGLEAAKQAVFKILQTERFRYLVYSFHYGVELEALIGQGPLFVRADIRRRIEEALLQDDRIRGISGLTLEGEGDQLLVRFTVLTDSGSFEVEQEVGKRV